MDENNTLERHMISIISKIESENNATCCPELLLLGNSRPLVACGTSCNK
jgi:hypothetical protein